MNVDEIIALKAAVLMVCVVDFGCYRVIMLSLKCTVSLLQQYSKH